MKKVQVKTALSRVPTGCSRILDLNLADLPTL